MHTSFKLKIIQIPARGEHKSRQACIQFTVTRGTESSLDPDRARTRSGRLPICVKYSVLEQQQSVGAASLNPG